jgi:nitroreductase
MEDGMEKPAINEYPIYELIKRRWSPRTFARKPIAYQTLCSLLEAARWAASSFNDQPWRYLVATQKQSDEFARMLACLNDRNQKWAKNASVLMLSVAAKISTRTGQPNRYALHDVGAASAQLTLEATSRGIAVHQMGGIDSEKIRETYTIPEDFEPVAALALGYPGELKDLPEEFRDVEIAPRQRRPVAEFAFAKTWGSPAELR